MKDIFKRQGAFSWSELMTTDVEGAKKFYLTGTRTITKSPVVWP
jgi:predicted enzyme related to lactoylglutathione lyase